MFIKCDEAFYRMFTTCIVCLSTSQFGWRCYEEVVRGYCYFLLRERDKIILLFQASRGGCNIIIEFRGRSS